MHLNFCNMIFITTICLIFPIVHAWPKRDCNDSSMNTTQKIIPKGNISKISEVETDMPGILDFLTREPDLSILNISFDNNEQVVDIFRSVLSESENKKPKTNLEDKHDNVMKSLDDAITGSSLTTTRNNSYNKIYANPIPKENGPSLPNSSQINYANAIELLKATISSLPAKDNENGNKKYNENSSIPKAASQDLDEVYKTSNNADQTTSEISLSEITNLLRDNGAESALGQKIEFQRSKMDLEGDENNIAGKEILQNTTGMCGYLLGKRVSFAEPTTLMEFPWTALLLYNTNIRYHCGGSLITTKYVLTAAHCVAQEFYELIGVRLGEYDISEPIDCALDVVGSKICAVTVDVNVVKIIIHHDYSHVSFKNDIALLRLDKEYISRSFYPICLPTPDMIYTDKEATVAGWGATEKAIRSSILLKATVPIFDISKCREIYRCNVFNDSTEICASGANEVDVCKGDSGGAIFYGHDDGRREIFYQLGVISLGVRGCGDKRFLPAIFTKLNAFYKWIESNLEY